MKRIISITIILALLVSMGSFSVSAIEVGPDAYLVEDIQIREFALSKALEAFPEYASKIKGEHLIQNTAMLMSHSTTPKVLVNETRMLSETEMVTYQEYDNGLVLTAFGFMAGKNVTDTSSGTGYSSTTMNIWLNYASADQTLLVNGVQYAHQQNNYGSITNKGYIDSSSDAGSMAVSAYKRTGDANGPAYLEYQAIFYVEQYNGFSIQEVPVWGFLLLEVDETSMSLNGNYSSIKG